MRKLRALLFPAVNLLECSPQRIRERGGKKKSNLLPRLLFYCIRLYSEPRYQSLYLPPAASQLVIFCLSPELS